MNFIMNLIINNEIAKATIITTNKIINSFEDNAPKLTIFKQLIEINLLSMHLYRLSLPSLLL